MMFSIEPAAPLASLLHDVNCYLLA